jgi:hypothetical protein
MFEGEEVVRNMKALQDSAQAKKREGLIQRLSEFLNREANGEAEHPAAIAEKELTAGNAEAVVGYLSSEIDKAAAQGDETRRGELMRWKVSLTQR